MLAAFAMVLAAGLAPSTSFAAVQNPPPIAPTLSAPRLRIDSASRIADPKLAGGAVHVTFHLETLGASADATLEVLRQGTPLVTLWSGALIGGAAPVQATWDGRDALGARCATGDYAVRVRAPGCAPAEHPVRLVRLGVVELEAQDSPGANDEFQMVYYLKGAAYAFYVTPAIHEYRNVAPAGGISDLDRDDGEPRPSVAVHNAVDAPVVTGGAYETATFNYPLAYIRGARPRLQVTFGSSATDSLGAPMGVGYPLPGYELRVTCDGAVAVAGEDQVTPGGSARIDLAPLPSDVRRIDTAITLRFQYRPIGAANWRDVAGALSIPLSFYTLLDQPRFKSGATGAQYSGPWVEVAEYVTTWKKVLGLPTTSQTELTALVVKGFFGQNGELPTAIEGVAYDAPPLGGVNGASHYFSSFNATMYLSRLLNGHASGRYVNCSDNMGAVTTMLSMLGANGVRPVRLSGMALLAIWGIGAPGYTLNLWGSGAHAFSYHHIVSDDGAVTLSDSCMQLDEDDSATALPGMPGWNAHRPWTGATGYNALSSSNSPTRTVEALPGLQ
jgi:hypothetical protein